MILLQPLESGKSKVGDKVKLAAAEPVRGSGGEVVVAAGALGTGSVEWSRRGSAMGSIANQPARLAVRVLSVRNVSGEEIPLEGMIQFRGDEKPRQNPYDLAASQLTAEQRRALEAFQEKGIDALDDDQVRAQIKTIFQDQRRDASESLFGTSEDPRARRTRELLRSGSLDRIGVNDITAIVSLGSLADSALNRLGRMLTAHQVSAQVGVVLPAKTSSKSSIILPSTTRNPRKN